MRSSSDRRGLGWVALCGGLSVSLLPVTGCASARGVTRSTGTALSGLGALTVLLAFTPEGCGDDFGEESCEDKGYSEQSLQTRAALVAGGGAAMLLGGGLVAASVPKKRKRPRPAPVPPPVLNARPPQTPSGRAMRELIEGRCLPEGHAVDLRVPAKADEPRTVPATCSVPAPAQ